MSAPLAKGIIIATSLLLAAGFAIYENDQVRQWVEQQRRKIFVAMNGGGPFTEQTRGRAETDEVAEELRDRNVDRMTTQLRDEMIRQHRQEIFRRAKEEGVAVDLDELKAVEEIFDRQQALLDEAARNKKEREKESGGLERRQSAQTFDELVGADGRLRTESQGQTVNATGVDTLSQGLRHRGNASAFDRGASFGANPFDDGSEALFDQALIGAGGEELASLLEPSLGRRETTPKPKNRIRNITVQEGRTAQEDEGDDVLATPYKTEQELNDEIQEAIRRSLEDITISSALDNYASHHMEEPSLLDQCLEEERQELVQSVRSDSEPLPAPSLSDATLLYHQQPHESHQSQSQEAPSMQNSIYESYYYGQSNPSSITVRETPLVSDPTRSTSSFHSAVADQLSTLRHTPGIQTQPQQQQHQREDEDADSDWDDAFTPTGTLTPTEDGLSITDGISELDYYDDEEGEASHRSEDLESSLYRDDHIQALPAAPSANPSTRSAFRDGITITQTQSPPQLQTQLESQRPRSRASSVAISEFSDLGAGEGGVPMASGTLTPASWTDVDSVVSGEEDGVGSSSTEERRRRRIGRVPMSS